jgi:N-acetylmuramoyl-L-alanine amidase
MRDTMRRNAALPGSGLRILFAFLVSLSVFSGSILADTNSSERRDSAKNQFDRAEKERQELEARPESRRLQKDYSAVVSSYKRVALITAHAAEVPQALNAVAELYCAMGDLFDVKFYQQSIDAYNILLKEYPASQYRESASLAIGAIQQNDLHDVDGARKSYQGFLALHPRSQHAAEVRAILAKLSQSVPAKVNSQPVRAKEDRSRVTSKPLVADAKAITDPQDDGSKPADARERSTGVELSGNSNIPQLTRIRTWNADTYTRIVIDVGAQVKYQAARITNPDRIYFDIENTKINSALLHKSIEVADGGLLKGVRIAQNQFDVVRVVLEVDRVKDYSVFLLPNPYRLIVDIYGNRVPGEETIRASAAPSESGATPPPETPAQNSDKKVADVKIPNSHAIGSKVAADRLTRPMYPTRLPGVEPSEKPPSIPSGGEELASLPASAMREPKAPGKPQNSSKGAANRASRTTASTSNNSDSGDDAAASSIPSSNSSSRPAKRAVTSDSSIDDEEPPLVARPASAKRGRITGKSAREQAEEMGPAPMPELTRDGQHSLTRALGLKIGRIVIDAGHGGHDTGTIGPSGLMEKDVCLDVALRLGKLIQRRLPGAEVVYTREDDTFIPLEKRTEIANDSRADLFLSVHGNSSQDHKARGIETYYLNFTGSSDAMEVASRENAFSGNSVADLQDIVQKITRNEKIGESRDFAGIIQDSLAKRLEAINRGDRSRGVRKAPFVVLIGANMPSVLSEISFLSNPSDEQWLKKPENRQRIAEGLYRGIESYLQSTNSLTFDLVHPSPGPRSGIVARSGNSQ